jgi:hypothetical protein
MVMVVVCVEVGVDEVGDAQRVRVAWLSVVRDVA